MDNSEQVARAVEALVKLLLVDQTPNPQLGRRNSDLMDIDSVSHGQTRESHQDQDQNDNSDAQESRIAAAQEYCHRILGSRMAPSVVSDEMHISDVIKKKLMREDSSSAKAIRFSHLYAKLSACPVVTKKWSILYLLHSLSNQSAVDNGQEDSTSRHHQSLPFLGLHNLDTPSAARLRSQERERTSTIQSDTTMTGHSRHGSLQIPTSTSSHQPTLGQHPDSVVSEIIRSQMGDELALLRDLIFLFQGINGKVVQFGSEYGTVVFDPSLDIPNSTKNLIKRLADLGWCYKKAKAYVDSTLQDPQTGLVVQQEFIEYFRLIAILESHIATDLDVAGSKGLSLRRLLVWTQETLQRLTLMSVLVENCKDLQGGALIAVVHEYRQHGDPLIQRFIHRLLERVSAPFYVMLQRWIYDGELEDPRSEFFIGFDPECREEDMWQRKYFIRMDMLPAFIGLPLAKKCDDGDWFLQNHGVGKSLRYGDIADLESSIDEAYSKTSKRLLSLLKTKFKLMDHLTAIKRYLLLGQGDFIQFLMESLGPSLSQPANTLFRHNLTGTLEAAIRGSNAQFDDPEVLPRLDVRLLEISSGDSGWDIFSLDYHMDSPINAIITPASMHQYLKMFNFLWRLKRVEHALSNAWRRQTTSARAIHPIRELMPGLHQCRIVCGEMIHFVYQLQYYILFEVLECSWAKLLKTIQKEKNDLDSVIEAHQRYLSDVTSKGLLQVSHDENLMSRMLEILATILDYKVAQDNLYDFALEEIERRRMKQREADMRTRMGRWGLTDADDALDKIPDEQFKNVVTPLLEIVNEYSIQFKREVYELLTTLAADGDSELKSLSTRLDFNKFYDKTLNVVLATAASSTSTANRKSTR
ncbi:Gamma-tubulin complex component 3 [Lunasporangiospora selenospora]|uniref:Gamma-tubulin complex component 3 n=1 Tax=Lunasporangiospora selenospora TaxID=979761 RepID=A0A9P6KG29_9FUNG|nr:Gamma-tubulin complex component 3 [Lunasporangiospora selenospora]